MNLHLAMSPLLDATPPTWTATTFKAVFKPVNERRGSRPIELLSLSSQGILRNRAEAGDRQRPSDDSLPRYLIAQAGDLVVNPMWLTGGAIAVSDRHGAVSPDYRVFRVRDETAAVPRYLHHLLRTPAAFAQYRLYTRADTTFDRRVQQGDLDALPVWLPAASEQLRIASFLDQQVMQIDGAIASCEELAAGAEGRRAAVIGEALLQAQSGSSSGLPWRLRADWVLAPVGAMYSLQLGKMLNDERSGGGRLRPYLRNTNVQWDVISTDDLKTMDFPVEEGHRYRLRAGDLLICEGGQPGRAAVWDGRPDEMYYQKALHRARPRNEMRSRWLLHLLYLCAARGAFADAQGTTIAHLTGEQLSALRLPFPVPRDQDELIEFFDETAEEARQLVAATRRQIALLQERKRVLVTACVTGEFDISTASDRASQAALQGVTL